jgi:hypothetical protein
MTTYIAIFRKVANLMEINREKTNIAIAILEI